MRKGTNLKINAQGMIASKRNKKDGCTIFGCVSDNDHGEVLNDFVIPQEDQGIGRRHMMIKFNTDNKMYYIRDLGEGSGTFVKLDTELVFLSLLTFLDSQNWLHCIVRRLSHARLNFTGPDVRPEQADP